jgi:hypothetical protein
MSRGFRKSGSYNDKLRRFGSGQVARADEHFDGLGDNPSKCVST